MIALKKILVPTDFSDTSAVAVRYARALADAFGASVHLIHVVEDPFVYGWTGEGYIPDLPQFRESLAGSARERLNQVFNPSEREKYHAAVCVLFGSSFLEIVRYAKQHEIDVIVMGTHGRGPIAHMLMGSVAEKVVRKAPCPVLTVRHPEHEFVQP